MKFRASHVTIAVLCLVVVAVGQEVQQTGEQTEALPKTTGTTSGDQQQTGTVSKTGNTVAKRPKPQGYMVIPIVGEFGKDVFAEATKCS